MTGIHESGSSAGLVSVRWMLVAGAVWFSSGLLAQDAPPDRREPGDIEPIVLLDRALGQLIFDVHDDAAGMSSALRGHSLARSMYGYNDQVLNVEPFNGTGRLHFGHGPDSGAVAGADDYLLINYQRFDGDPIRDPERYGTRADPTETRPYFTGGFNAPYTYPDANNMFLAAVRADGNLVTPSFHREWISGSLDDANPNWSAPDGKYRILRPRPREMGPGFPVPERFGDVRQLDGAAGGNDSIWMDLGFPVQVADDGRQFKPLFAFLVVDLDHRIDVNLHGNVLNVGPSSGSSQGWGPWEVNLKHVLNSARRRHRITTASRDVRRPSITPWIWDRQEESLYDVPPGDPAAPPSGPEIPFPDFVRRGDPFGNPGLSVPPFSDLRTPGFPPDDPETDWRGFRSLALVAQGIDSAGGGDRTLLNRLSASIRSRIDLNRTLPSYPRPRHFASARGLEHALDAQKERQQFAEEIYRQLLAVGGVSPVPDGTIPNPRDEDLAPHRWLAQLAVNIVDYIDEDEIATSFNFYSPHLDGLDPDDADQGTNTPAGELLPRYWVFGTEMPRVVLNEVMAEYEEPDGKSGSGEVIVKVWAELYRPVRDVPAPDPNGRPRDGRRLSLFARSVGGGGYSIYQIVIANTDPGRDTPLHRDPGNVTGAPEDPSAVTEFLPTVGTVGDPDRSVPSTIGADRYLIVGPRSDGGQDEQQTIRPTRSRPPSTRWYRSEDMEFPLESTPSPGQPRPGITVLLRRLANPHLPPDPRPVTGGGVNPAYNPYITVDYLEDLPPRDASETSTQSTGKLQPYASHRNRLQSQAVEQGGGTRHTLGEPNEPKQAFDWLVHLDRKLISPVELLQVSGVRPHELTHRFITTSAGDRPDFAHRAPWFDEDLVGESGQNRASHRLYRLFEHLETKPRAAGRGAHGRVSGRINLNTIYDREAFLDLAGPAGGSQLDEFWNRLLELRSPGLVGPESSLTEDDRPFLSPGVGILPPSDPQSNGRGINVDDTIFRSWDPGAPGDARRLFDVEGDHPYDRKELLLNIHDSLTTRSNVFAVWITVGFFEVVDDRTSPPRLGREIGEADGTEVRHRFFAIVDRSQLQLFGQLGRDGDAETTRYLTRSDAQWGFVPRAGRHWVPVEALSGRTATERRDATGAPTGEFLPWRIVPGSYLFVDTGRDREMVLVTNVDPTSGAIQADFSRRHGRGFEVSIPGNPGPQSEFDARGALYRDVIRWAVSISPRNNRSRS